MVNGRANFKVIHWVNGARGMTTKNKKSKPVPPSRVRYTEANPTVSVRISQELKGDLEDLKEMSGLSMANILKAGMDKLKPDVDQFYDQGLKDGYEMAEEEFKVLATCSGCEEAHLPVVGERMKAVAAQRLIGWTGRSCR